MRGASKVGAALLAAMLAMSSPLPCPAADNTASRHFRSLQEIRHENIVRQRWDMSCGAAALSTLLTYDLRRPTSESEVVIWILRRTDPVKVQARGGFSLFDLKRFALSRGLQSEGYAELTLQELADLRRPAIVPMRMKGFDHFVVFRGIAGDRVQFADPAFGNLTMTATRFSGLWKGGIAFVVLPRQPVPPLKSSAVTVPDGGSLHRAALDASIGHPTRLTP